MPTLNKWAALCTTSKGTRHCRATSSARLSVLLPGIILHVGTLPPVPAQTHSGCTTIARFAPVSVLFLLATYLLTHKFDVLGPNRGPTDNENKSVKTVTNNDLQSVWHSQRSIKIAH